ncbi:hypothetical protein AB0F09_19310 [Streptomyces olivaceus]|uniref:hypothetical protein n=1 Tax=Streptomyces olivaceus TaxID=47716 RepID=UPI0033C41B0D
MDAYTFNRLYPVRTRVLAYPETRAERPKQTAIRTAAVDVQDGLTVVHVDVLVGPIDIRGIDPLPDNYPVEA